MTTLDYPPKSKIGKKTSFIWNFVSDERQFSFLMNNNLNQLAKLDVNAKEDVLGRVYNQCVPVVFFNN